VKEGGGFFGKIVKVCLKTPGGPVLQQALMRHPMKKDPMSGHCFIFTNRSRSRTTLLYWDGSGTWILAKRLDNELTSSQNWSILWASLHINETSLPIVSISSVWRPRENGSGNGLGVRQTRPQTVFGVHRRHSGSGLQLSGISKRHFQWILRLSLNVAPSKEQRNLRAHVFNLYSDSSYRDNCHQDCIPCSSMRAWRKCIRGAWSL